MSSSGIQNFHVNPSLGWQIQNHFERVAIQRRKVAVPPPNAPRPYDWTKFMPRPDFIVVMDTNGDISLMSYAEVVGQVRSGALKILRHENNYNEMFEESQLVDMPDGVLPATRLTLNQSFNYPRFG
jgi:hypothetical protein